MEDQPAAWGGGVQRLVQGPEPGAVAAQPGHDGDQVLQGPGQPVQARHHQGVACEEVVQARRELRPVGGLARQLVGEHPKTADLGQGADLPVQVSARKSTPGRTRSARRSGSPAQARAVVIGAGEAGRGRRHPPDRTGNGGAGVFGHVGFSTRFSGTRHLPEIRIEGRPGGCLRIVRYLKISQRRSTRLPDRSKTPSTTTPVQQP